MFELCLTFSLVIFNAGDGFVVVGTFYFTGPCISRCELPFYRMVAVFYWGNLSHSVCFKQMDG